jgi:hypothetical protein
MNAWMVGLALGNRVSYVNWIRRRLVTTSMGVSFIFIEEMRFWGEMARLDSSLLFCGSVFHSH